MQLRVDGLSFRYPAQEDHALNNITLNIEPGRVTWLTGALGSGTSTLLLALSGLAPRLSGGERSGVVLCHGFDPSLRQPLTEGIAWLGPSPGLQLSGVAKSVRDEVAIGPMNLGWSRDRILAAADAAMERLGVSHLAERAPGALSGGETQRVLLAALLAASPRVWLLDEPFSALDRGRRARVGTWLRELAGEGATVVVSCDDADAMLGVADRVVVLQQGRITIDGDPRTVLAGAELGGASTTDAATLAGAAKLGTPHPLTVPILLARVELAAIDASKVIAPSTAVTSNTERLSLDRVEFSYVGGTPVLRETSLQVAGGSAVGLFGLNGAGKSTLLRLAMALEQPSHGVVRTLGEATNGRGPEELAPRVGFLFQQPERQLFAASVRAECAVAPILAGWDAARVRAATDAVLEELDLLDVAEEHPYDLPLPRRRLVALASILVTDPILLLLDEPTAGLDGVSRERVAVVVRERVARGAAVLAITHDAAFAHEALDRGLHLEQGRIIFDGPVRELLNDRDLTRPAALAVAMQLGLPIGIDRRQDVASVLTSARRM